MLQSKRHSVSSSADVDKPASPRQEAEERQAVYESQIASKLRVVIDELNEIDRQLTPLKDRRAILASERDRLRKFLYDPRTFENRNGSGQGLYVHSRYFMPYVEEWIAQYDASNGGLGGQLALAKKSNVSAKNIRSYKNGSITYGGIMTVDRLLSAIEKEHLIDNMPFKTTAEIGLGSNRPTEVPEPPPMIYNYED